MSINLAESAQKTFMARTIEEVMSKEKDVTGFRPFLELTTHLKTL